jgi:hypothetical protein
MMVSHWSHLNMASFVPFYPFPHCTRFKTNQTTLVLINASLLHGFSLPLGPSAPMTLSLGFTLLLLPHLPFHYTSLPFSCPGRDPNGPRPHHSHTHCLPGSAFMNSPGCLPHLLQGSAHLLQGSAQMPPP